MTPLEATLMFVPEVYWRRLRKICAVVVVIDEGDEVFTIEIVNVGPETPLMVVVAEPPDPHVPKL